jgi:hypothetical protein
MRQPTRRRASQTHVGLDQPRLLAVVLAARPRVERADELHRRVRLFRGHLRRARQVLHVALLQQLQVRSTISAATSMLRRRSRSCASASARKLRCGSVLVRLARPASVQLVKLLLLGRDLQSAGTRADRAPPLRRGQDAAPGRWRAAPGRAPLYGLPAWPFSPPLSAFPFPWPFSGFSRDTGETPRPALLRSPPDSRPRPDCRSRTPRLVQLAPGSELPAATPGDRTRVVGWERKFSNEGFSLSSYSGCVR